ncbi:MAG: hypothetical protein ACR2ME_04715 [Acidimicrobiia bacterium]
MKLGPGGHGRWLAVLLSGLAAGVVVTYFILPRRVVSTEVDESICTRAFVAADGINAYLADRATLDPGPEIHPLVGIPQGDRDELWAEYLEESDSYTAQTVAGFNTNFAAETQFLVERFSAAGYWIGAARVNVVNKLAVIHLAQELDATALRAGCRR